MGHAFFRCVALYTLFTAGGSWAVVISNEQPDELHQAVEAAQSWLEAKPADRADFEADLKEYDGNIDEVIAAIMPRGSEAFDEIKGREVKGDTFTVPELSERNADHPFNYYVPPHYDRSKPMGLILWMHGGGTYKPGKNVKRRSVEGKLEELRAGDYIFVAAEACHGMNFPNGAVESKLAGRWSVPASERWVSIEEFSPGPVPVDHLVKTGTIRKAESYEQWLDYSARRARGTFRGARIEVENLGNNKFKATTLHVESYSLWLHPNIVDFDRPIEVTTNGVTAEYTCTPSILIALKSYERRNDWGLIYHAKILVRVTGTARQSNPSRF